MNKGMIPNSDYPDTGESGEAYDIEQHSLPSALEERLIDDTQLQPNPMTRE
jgi:hypothetical protein